jgi:hypothetical protein
MARVKTGPRGRTRTAIKPYCYDCCKPVRSLIEHRTTATHLASRSSIKDRGAKGRSAYRGPLILPRPEADYDAWLEEKYLDSLPPSIDDVFPTEIRDPLPERHAERDHRPEPCGRCGKAFRTDAGARWHATNNLDCERWARKSRAA